MISDQLVFIDEAGTPDLNKDCYAICAVISSTADMAENRALVQQIRSDRRSGAELKSSAVGSRFEIRKEICRDLSLLKIRVVVLAINKAQLDPESGLKYKRSSYKYFQRRLFEKVYRDFSSVSVTIDTYGNQEFMDGFCDYIDRHFQPTIFNQQKTVSHSTPEAEPMLQVSDFIAGTVRRVITKDDPDDAYRSLLPIISLVEVWPRAPGQYRYDHESSDLDLQIEDYCTKKSIEILEAEENPILRESIAFLMHFFGESPDTFIFGDEILSHLKTQALIGPERDKNWLQQNVIAPLRDKGVPIAASRDGYKIPRNKSDLSAFVGFVSQKTLPYLKKVNNLRSGLFLSIGGAYDMLDEDPQLKELMSNLGKTIS
jgi:hypothetical protein